MTEQELYTLVYRERNGDPAVLAAEAHRPVPRAHPGALTNGPTACWLRHQKELVQQLRHDQAHTADLGDWFRRLQTRRRNVT